MEKQEILRCCSLLYDRADKICRNRRLPNSVMDQCQKWLNTQSIDSLVLIVSHLLESNVKSIDLALKKVLQNRVRISLEDEDIVALAEGEDSILGKNQTSIKEEVVTQQRKGTKKSHILEIFEEGMSVSDVAKLTGYSYAACRHALKEKLNL